MPTTTLRPGAVYYYDPTIVGADTYPSPASVAGSGAVWADDSDASYVDVHEAYFNKSTTMSADFPPVPGATVTEITIRARGFLHLATLPPFGSAVSENLLLFSDAGGSTQIWTTAAPFTTANEWVEWTPLGFTGEDAMRTTGLRVSVYGDNSISQGYSFDTFRLIELELLVTYEGGAPTGLPPLRQDLCRDDSRVGRVWPASSQQDSIRRLGYF